MRASRPLAGRPIRVLHVLGALDRGGVETWLLDLLPRLPCAWRFDFCALGTQEGRYASVARRSGCHVFTCPITENPSTFPIRLWRLLRGGDYSIVHSHVHQFSAVVLAIARAAGLRACVAHSHNTADGHADGWLRRLYRRFGGRLLDATRSAGIACSSEAAESLFGPAWRANPQIFVLHYGLNGGPPPSAGNTSAVALRRHFGISPVAPVLGHVGRFHAQKNHDFLLEVAAALRPRRPAARWLLVGDGPERPRIEQRAHALGLSDALVFCGLRDDVPELLGAMDAFVFPSLYEGLPLALLEAQGAGLRAVASSRISREASAVNGALRFLPLEAGPAAWADAALGCLDRGKIPASQAYLGLDAGGFGIAQSLHGLLDIYRLALAIQRAPRTPARKRP